MNSIILPKRLNYTWEKSSYDTLKHKKYDVIYDDVVNPISVLSRKGNNKISPTYFSHDTIHLFACLRNYNVLKNTVQILENNNEIYDTVTNYKKNISYDDLKIFTKNVSSDEKINLFIYNLDITNIGNIIKNMEIGSSLIIIYDNILTASLYSMILYLSSCFNESYLHYYLYYPTPKYEIIVFKNLLNKIDENIVSHIPKIDNDIFINFYNMYLKKVKRNETYDNQIEILYNSSNIDNELLKKETYNLAVMYAKQIKLPLYEWIDIDETIDHYYQKSISNVLNTLIPYKHKFEFKCNMEDIGIYDKIKGDYSILKQFYKSNEEIFTYTDSIDNKTFRNVELIFNYNQKKLEKFLFVKYNVNTAGRYVNRAFIKLFELYEELKYFDNLIDGDTVTAFHICEAPGNFISSSIYYLKNINKNYNWVAQSLVKGDIFDEYGFIKKNKEKWDFGKDKSGDIMNYDNFIYYYDKYKNIDSLIGDCGVPWTSKNKKNTGAAQLIYSILFPRVGGNFVIKLLSTNADLLFISLLYCVTCRYDKVYIFKSSRNIWSSEIYIVGIGKKSINENDEKNLIKIFEGLSKNEIIYPVNKLDEYFFMEYIYINEITLMNYTTIKKFFIHMAYDYKFFIKEKSKLEKILDKKNIYWLENYMKFIPNIVQNYKEYNE